MLRRSTRRWPPVLRCTHSRAPHGAAMQHSPVLQRLSAASVIAAEVGVVLIGDGCANQQVVASCNGAWPVVAGVALKLRRSRPCCVGAPSGLQWSFAGAVGAALELCRGLQWGFVGSVSAAMSVGAPVLHTVASNVDNCCIRWRAWSRASAAMEHHGGLPVLPGSIVGAAGAVIGAAMQNHGGPWRCCDGGDARSGGAVLVDV